MKKDEKIYRYIYTKKCELYIYIYERKKKLKYIKLQNEKNCAFLFE